jgi:hypothetical protein
LGITFRNLIAAESTGSSGLARKELARTADFRAYQVLTRDTGLPTTRDFRACQRQWTSGLARDKIQYFRSCQKPEVSGLAVSQACNRLEILGLARDQGFQCSPETRVPGLARIQEFQCLHETRDFRGCQRPGILYKDLRPGISAVARDQGFYIRT